MKSLHGISPHLCVGFLFLVVHFRLAPPGPASPPPQLAHTTCSHTTCHHTTCHHTTCSHTQLAHTHTQLVTTQLVTTQLVTTQLDCTQLAHTHNLHTHTQLTHTHTTCHHTTCSHITCTHTHTTCSPHNLFTHTHTSCSHTTCHHTTYSHTHNLSRHRSSLCVAFIVLGWLRWRAWVGFGAVVAAAVCFAGLAGVVLGDIDVHSAWQAWHLSYWAGSGGALVLGLAPWSPPPFAWQAWHLATSIATLRGRCGTWRHGRAFCVAGVELIVLGWLRWCAWVGFGAGSPPPLAWQPWHLVTSSFTLRVLVWLLWRLGWVWRRGRRHRLRGRRGTWRHRSSLCVAGVVLGDINMHSAWQAWHLSYWAGSGGALGLGLAPWSPPPFAWQAWHLATSIATLRGRCGTCDMDVHSAWQAWHLSCWAGCGGARVWRRGRRRRLRGRRGRRGDMDMHSAWQAWHLSYWAGSGGALGLGFALWSLPPLAWKAWHLVTSSFILRGRRGTCGNMDVHSAWQAWRLSYWAGSGGALGFGAVVAVAVCVAGVALGDIDRHFACQVWYLATWTCILRGRRGTYRTGLAPVLGLAPWSPPPLAWQAWHLATSIVTLRGRRGTWRHRRAFCVAGVALIVLGWLRWCAWVGFGGRRHRLRGRHGTWRHRSPLCVAGVVLGDMDVHSAWQAWHLSYWAGSGGALGFLAPWSPPPFAWQAWHLATSIVTLRGWRHRCILRGRRGT